MFIKLLISIYFTSFILFTNAVKEEQLKTLNTEENGISTKEFLPKTGLLGLQQPNGLNIQQPYQFPNYLLPQLQYPFNIYQPPIFNNYLRPLLPPNPYIPFNPLINYQNYPGNIPQYPINQYPGYSPQVPLNGINGGIPNQLNPTGAVFEIRN
ncbi:hypothetical protein Mgra_00007146 [Meloidogyne graminicola]|uniref:Uncharacterized protein n=1 Tax=Meloidogyne graminicola TaxID=189291 RepID=A0A8S9ZJL6_9BILA|nr:hypothetical protein Mgra_00007146 [Meloidogyne graminicola]